jgi:DNA invertase Pin-like site-specific DNA recombinase
MPRLSPFTSTSATAELIEEFGMPRFVASAGVQLRIWEIDPRGDGLIVARLSGKDVQGGETAMGQVHALRALAHTCEIAPRAIVVGCNNPGPSRYELRPDFAYVEHAIEAGWCRWVAWRDADRIGRSELSLALFYDLLRRTRTALYLTELGRAVDWDKDRLSLGLKGLLSVEEHEKIKQRTHGALERIWVREGRGWPGKRPFGFRRNWLTKFLEPDPEQWPFVKFIHLRYAELEDGQGGGLRRLEDELREQGCELSRNRIRRVLRDPIYATGEYSFTFKGEIVPCKPVELDDAVPLELHTRNNRVLAARRGGESSTPRGLFCLNLVPVVHRRCADQHDAAGRQAKLRGRVQRGRDVRVYRHAPFVPAGCRGFVVDQRALEHPVLERLRERLLGDPELRRHWNERSEGFDRGPDGGETFGEFAVATVHERNVLKRQIALLTRRKTQLGRRLRSTLAADDSADARVYAEVIEGFACEIEQLRRRLETRPRAYAQPDPPRSLADALTLVCSPDVDTPAARHARMALVRTLIRRIELDERNGALALEVCALC